MSRHLWPTVCPISNSNAGARPQPTLPSLHHPPHTLLSFSPSLFLSSRSIHVFNFEVLWRLASKVISWDWTVALTFLFLCFSLHCHHTSHTDSLARSLLLTHSLIHSLPSPHCHLLKNLFFFLDIWYKSSVYPHNPTSTTATYSQFSVNVTKNWYSQVKTNLLENKLSFFLSWSWGEIHNIKQQRCF